MKEKIFKILGHNAIFEIAKEGGVVVNVPSLDCVTEGETMEEAMKMTVDLINCVKEYERNKRKA